MTTVNLERLLRSREVAELLGVSSWQVDELRRRGLIVAISIGSRCFRYDPKDVAEFVRRHRG